LLNGLARRVGQRPPEAPLSLPPEPTGVEVAGLRHRRLGLPAEILDRALAQKVLNGWLQNRHQVMLPLTFRLGRLEAGAVEVLMRFAATALLDASRADEAARRGVERWLAEIGADEAALATFRSTLGAPTPSSTLLEAVRAHGLEPYAYAAAVVAADLRDPAGYFYASYVAARLALPADMVRSIDRRYRR
jgi:uncharacterized membrane protein YebE (DUF533 family)